MSNPTTHTEQFNGSLGGFAGVDPIRYNNGSWVEEGTTNHIVNADFAADTTGWTVNGTGSVVLTRRTDTGLAPHVCQVACDGAGASQGIFSSPNIAALQGEVWALSVDIAGAVGGETCRMNVAMRNSGGSAISELTSAPFPITNGLVRYTYIVTLTEALTAFIRVKVLGPATAAAQTFFVDGFQLEKRGYATSLALSTMGAGYTSGTGSVHVRAASSASISPSGILAPGSGSLAFRITPTIETGVEEIWGECGVKGAGTDHLRWGRDASTHPFVEWSANDAAYQRLTGTETLPAGTAYDLYLGHTGTVISLAVDAGTLQTGTRAAVSGDFSTGDLTLEASAGGVIYQPFATFNRTLTAKEIATLNGKNNWTMKVLAGNPYRNFQLRPY